MYSFQSFIKMTRDSKGLEQQTVADATNLSLDTIKTIEEAHGNLLLQESSTVLKNQIRRYCEYLEVSEKKIVSILNKIDILYYKKAKYGKMKAFDYINRLIIVAISITLIVLVFAFVKKHASIDTNETAQNTENAPIIYTPINYSDEFQNGASSDESKKVEAHPPPQANMNSIVIDDNISDNNSNITESKTSSKKVEAHPPAQANMDSIVIDDNSSSNTSVPQED
ncbi:helix-turn-helix domain-containing protein [Pseudofrancisella aestuarii]|uniref:Helix-turn-helix domain-containing protein n=1 Tax=Pseudofrancisella aestuarii TaxID=2670347 RepID=A0ABV9TD03_9GAMM|nr:helix-turn-helix domain-containing protein [Pseudofrancisella aestuarii]